MGKIVPIKMKLRNFLSFGNRFQEFTFNKGVNIIQGYDSNTGKSNGAGKSSIMEAVCFCLYGKTIKNIKKDKIPNWLNNSKCEVQLTFIINDDEYVFYRSIKPNKFNVYKNGDMLPVLSNIRDFQFKIEQEILGMDFKSFSNLIYFSPNTTVSILDAKKDQKRKFLESLFDLSIYSDMLKECNNQLSINNEKVSLTNNDISHLETQISTINDRLSSYVVPNIKKEQNKLAFDKQMYASLKKEFDDCAFDEDEYNNVVSLLDAMNKEMQDISIKIVKLESDIKSKTDAINLIDIEKIKNKHSELTNKINELKSELKDEDELQSSKEENEKIITELEIQLDNFIGNNDKLQTLLIKVNERLAIYNSRIYEYNNADKLDGKSKCPVCIQDIDHNLLCNYYTNKINDTQKQIDIFESKKSVLLDKIKSSDVDINNIKNDIKKRKVIISDIDSIIAKNDNIRSMIEHYTNDLNSLDNIDDMILKRDALSKDIDNIKKDISLLKHKYTMLETDISIKNDIIDRFNKEKDYFYKQKNDIDRLSELIKVEIDNINKLIELNDNISKQIDSDKRLLSKYNNEIKDNVNRIKSINKIIDHIEYLKLSLKDDNIKQYAISSILPFLNKQTNMYLQKSGFPYSVSIDGWLDVTIIGFGVDNVDYNSLSGGERKSVSLALQFAANDVSLLQAKNSFSMMILDEMIDSSFDAVSLMNIMEIVNIKQKETDSCVYIITHKDEVKDFDFNNTILINKKNGYSVIN